MDPPDRMLIRQFNEGPCESLLSLSPKQECIYQENNLCPSTLIRLLDSHAGLEADHLLKVQSSKPCKKTISFQNQIILWL